MKKSLVVVLVTVGVLLSGCAASVDSVDLGNGFKRYFSRGGVEVGDCGTQLMSDLFYVRPDKKEEYVTSHSERGHALHCDLSVAIIDAGATVGAANQIRRGLSAGGSSTSISNTQGDQVQSQAQGQLQQQESVNSAKASATTKVKQIGGGESGGGGSKHGNNGKGNGSGDGSPNGKEDKTR